MVSLNRLILDRAYRNLARAKVQARIETLLEAYKRENLIPSDGDINEISWELQDIILNVSPELSVEVKAMLEKEANRIIQAARDDIKIFIQEQELERKNARTQKTEPANPIHYNINIGENRGPIQQGGEGNTQSATIELLREKNEWLNAQLELSKEYKPDILLERKEKRLQLMEAELIKLSEDYEKNATLIAQKEEQIKALLGEIDVLKAQIDICPFCGAPLQTLGYLEPGTPHLGTLREYYCGYKVIEDSYGETEKAIFCPSDPEYPSLDEFDIFLQQSIIKSDEWFCFISAKTEKATHVKPLEVTGRTEEEALENLKKRYYSKYPFLNPKQG
jgi:hypothetical protein